MRWGACWAADARAGRQAGRQGQAYVGRSVRHSSSAQAAGYVCVCVCDPKTQRAGKNNLSMAIACDLGSTDVDTALHCTLSAVARNSTVLMTATDTSSEFEELLENWLCHTRRLGIAPLVWALDDSTHRKLRTRQGVHSFFMRSLSLPQSARPSAYKRPSSEEYTVAVALKPLVILRVVRLGFDALFLDVDIALIADPLPWLLRSANAAMQVSLNYDDRPAQQQVTGVPDLNTGVLYARSNPGMITLLSEWARRTAERHQCPRRPPLWKCVQDSY